MNYRETRKEKDVWAMQVEKLFETKTYPKELRGLGG